MEVPFPASNETSVLVAGGSVGVRARSVRPLMFSAHE